MTTSREGGAPVEPDARHDHPGHPEEEDVEGRHEDGRRVEAREVRRLVRPAEDRERHEPRREPGVEDVGVAASAAARRTSPQADGSASPGFGTVTCPSGQYHAGISCPHQSWRETHQSRMFFIHSSYVFFQSSGTKRVSPASVAATAFSASGPIFTNHWSETSGSRTVSQRWQRPIGEDVRLLAAAEALRRRGPGGPSSAPRPGRARRTPRPASAVIFPSKPMTVDDVEAVPPPRLEVVRVVRRRDLHDARPELRVDERVRDDGDRPARQRERTRFPTRPV